MAPPRTVAGAHTPEETRHTLHGPLRDPIRRGAPAEARLHTRDRGALSAVPAAATAPRPPLRRLRVPAGRGDRLRVGVIATTRHPIREPFAGGLEAHTAQLVRGLVARGHDVRLFASADSDPGLPVAPLCPSAVPLALTDAARRDPSMVAEPFMEDHHAYLQLMLDLARRTDLDVVQNNSLHYLPVAMAGTVPCPVVTTLHTPPTPWLESALGAGPTRSPTSLVTVSRANAEAWSPRADVERVIPNGVDTSVWRPRRGPVEDRAVWMGRIVPEKGLDLALRAAHAAGTGVDIVGPVHDPTYFENVVRPLLGADDRVLGHLRTADLARLVGARSVCLVTPRWAEPFGLVVAEALACGTPVAAFARGAIPELVTAATGALAAPDDVAGLAAAIGVARRVDRDRCARLAASRWSVDRMVVAYETHYAGLCRARA